MINVCEDAHILLLKYEESAALTDRFLDNENLIPVQMGLFGEVGSVMSTSKKLQREREAFRSVYEREFEEELGDALWYLAALCKRLNFSLADLFSEVLHNSVYATDVFTNSAPKLPLCTAQDLISNAKSTNLDTLLLNLGEHVTRLLKVQIDSIEVKPLLLDFIRVYIDILRTSSVSLSAVLSRNITKVKSRFQEPSHDELPDFDENFPLDEQLPRKFEIEIAQRSNGQSYLRWKGVFIGNPLSDNIAEADGYRFHDVFHLANAAILHWSPTFRALIKHKRKSNVGVEEAQDSGRAIAVDEGVSAYIFSHAKELDFFQAQDSVSFSLLKEISGFVRGFEVDQCPLYLWEQAILQGYDVFRKIYQHKGGFIVGDRYNRTIQYRSSLKYS